MSVGWNASIDARNFFSSKALFIFRPTPVGNINHKHYCPLLLLWQLKFRTSFFIHSRLLDLKQTSPQARLEPRTLWWSLDFEAPRKLNRSSLNEYFFSSQQSDFLCFAATNCRYFFTRDSVWRELARYVPARQQWGNFLTFSLPTSPGEELEWFVSRHGKEFVVHFGMNWREGMGHDEDKFRALCHQQLPSEVLLKFIFSMVLPRPKPLPTPTLSCHR